MDDHYSSQAMDDINYISSLESKNSVLEDYIDELRQKISDMEELYCAFDCSSCRDENDEPFYGNPEYQ